MLKRYYFRVLILVFMMPVMVAGQDINFSQFYEMPLLRNPSLAGMYKGDMKLSTAYRNQWQSVTSPYKTYALGFEYKSALSQNSPDFLSIGLQMTNDLAGDSKMGKTQMLPMVTYHKLIFGPSNTYLSLGFIGGPVQQKYDPTGLTFDDQFVDGNYSPLNPTRQSFTRSNLMYFDAGFGVNVSSELGATKVYAGTAYFHFTQPKVAYTAINDIRLNKKLAVNMGLNSPLSDYDNVIMYGDVFFQGGSSQFQGGALLMHHSQEIDEEEGLGIGVGAFYRWNDAFIPVLKMDWYKISLGVTYDVNVGPLKTASMRRGGLEMAVTYKTYLNIMNSSLQKVRCVVPF